MNPSGQAFLLESETVTFLSTWEVLSHVVENGVFGKAVVLSGDGQKVYVSTLGKKRPVPILPT